MTDCLKEMFTAAYGTQYPGGEAEMDYLSEVYAALTMTSVKWCLNHDYEMVKDVAHPFIRHILAALKEFLQSGEE